jgi:hypothetical protein
MRTSGLDVPANGRFLQFYAARLNGRCWLLISVVHRREGAIAKGYQTLQGYWTLYVRVILD